MFYGNSSIRNWLQLALALPLVAACASPVTPTPGSLSPAFPSATPPLPSGLPSPQPSPSASPQAFLDPDSLPLASLADENVTSICDPDANQFNPEAGTGVPCYDGLLQGLRALHTAVAHVDRIYLRRIRCQQVPCSTSELSVSTVTGWSGTTAFSVVFDGEHQTITVPQPDPLAVWPNPPFVQQPPIARIEIAGEPQTVRDRDPFPYCGDAPDGPSPIRTCFLAAVLGAGQAEMLDHDVLNGYTFVLRFDRQGPIWRFGESEKGWFRDGGSLILGIDAVRWDFDSWIKAEPIS